jgi:4'-phosphopantetheinyl transferase EntD
MTTDRDELSLAIRRELPAAIALSGGAIETARGELFAVEAAAVERVVAKRRDEFVAGRTNARRALAELGVAPVPIPIGPRRAPVWPSGITGSISHCKGYCTAIVARTHDFAGIGIDVELDEPVSDGVAARICFGDELADRAAVEGRIGMDLPKLLFSIKESVYKAYFPLAETFLEFSDVAVDLDPRENAFVARLTSAEPPSAAGARIFRGRFARAAGIVASWTIVPSSAPSPTLPGGG